MRRGARSITAVALGMALVLGGCGDDDPEPLGQLPKNLSPAPTLDASLTPPPLTPAYTPGADTSDEAGAATPDEAALTLHDHWVEGDSTAALETATQQAVNELFAHTGNPLDFQGCAREASRHTCFFYYEGGGLNMIVRGSPAKGYLVTKAFFVAD